jgi:O-antigen/teichoic acid export membrane protein
VFEFARVRGMLRYGLSMNGSKMLSYLSGNADNLIVGKVIGGQALGLYNMAFILGTMPTQKVTPIIYRISFPVLSRLQSDAEASRQYFLSFSRYIGMCAAAAMFGLMIVADDFVLTVLGQKWAPMIFPLRLLCGVGVLKALAVMLNVVLSARDRTGTLLVYCIAELAVLSAAFLIGARFGIGGVALGWLAAYPLLFLYQLRAVLRELDLRLSSYLQTLKLELLASGAMVVVALAVRSAMPVPGLLRLGATAAAGGLAYVAVVLCDRSLRDRALAVISRIGMTKARSLAAEQASSSQV